MFHDTPAAARPFLLRKVPFFFLFLAPLVALLLLLLFRPHPAFPAVGDPPLEFSWAIRTVDTNVVPGDHEAAGAAVDSDGNVLVTGFFTGTVDFDETGGGSFLTSAGGNDAFLAKYDGTDGTLIWVANIGSANKDQGTSVVVDSSDNVYVAGFFSGNILAPTTIGDPTPDTDYIGGEDVFVAKYDPDGNCLWMRTMGGTNNERGLALDVGSSVYVTGYFYGTANFGAGSFLSGNGNSDVFVAVLNPDNGDSTGVNAWQIGGTGNDGGRAIALDSSGNVYTAGYFSNSVDFDPSAGTQTRTATGGSDVFIASYAANSTFRWVSVGTGTGNDSASDIAVDAQTSSVYTTGYFNNTINFGSGSSTSAGDSDVFVTRHATSSGALQWVRTATGPGKDDATGIVQAGESLYIGGYFHSTLSFGSGTPLASRDTDTSDSFIASYRADNGSLTWAVDVGDEAANPPSNDHISDIAVQHGVGLYMTGFFDNNTNLAPDDDAAGDLDAPNPDTRAVFVAALQWRPGISFGELPLPTAIEGGNYVEYSIKLDSRPADTVRITLSFTDSIKVHIEDMPNDPDEYRDAATLGDIFISPDEWDTPVPVYVRATDDSIIQGDPTFTRIISHTAASTGDPDYNGTAVFRNGDGSELNEVVVTVEDNDEAAITFSETYLSLDENFPDDVVSYKITFGSEPLSDVDITLTPGEDLEVSVDGGSTWYSTTTTLTIPPIDWKTGGRVRVRLVGDDSIDKGNIYYYRNITHRADSTDPNYDSDAQARFTNGRGKLKNEVQVEIEDNDDSSVILSKSNLWVAELGNPISDTYTIELGSVPAHPVDVKLTFNKDQVTVNGETDGSVTVHFDPATWDTVHTITVVAVDDSLIEGDHTSIIYHEASSTDPNYDSDYGEVFHNGLDTNKDQVTVNITDDDDLTVVVDVGDGVKVREHTPPPMLDDYTDEYAVSLYRRPAEGQIVVIEVKGQASPAQVQVSKDGTTFADSITLTFNHDNWELIQTVTVRAVDDALEEDNPHYDVIEHIVKGGSDGTTDQRYQAVVGFSLSEVDVRIIENDRGPGISIATEEEVEPVELCEGDPENQGCDTATYEVWLNTVPTGENHAVVTIEARNAECAQRLDLGRGFGNPVSLTFPQNDTTSLIPQPVTITVKDDDIYQGDRTCDLFHSVTTPSGEYDDTLGIEYWLNGRKIPDPHTLPVHIIDDEEAAIILSTGTLEVEEDGGRGEYTLTLGSKPTYPVNITLSFDGEQIEVDATGSGVFDASGSVSLQFLPDEWQTEKTVYVRAVDDDHDLDRTPAITHRASSSDDHYDSDHQADIFKGGSGTNEDQVVVTILDDEKAGFQIDKPDDYVDESVPGKTLVYRLSLGSKPFQDVEITLRPRANYAISRGTVIESEAIGRQLEVRRGSSGWTNELKLTFSAEPGAGKLVWDSEQIIEVRAADDPTAETILPALYHQGLIDHVALSADSTYNSMTRTLQINIKDDDIAGLVADVDIESNEDEVLVQEEGETTDIYTVILTSKPTKDVVITANGRKQVRLSSDGVSFAPTLNLTFTPDNWTTVQTVTVRAVDDNIDELDLHEGIIEHTVNHDLTLAQEYLELGFRSIENVVANIGDNDEAQVQVLPIEVTVPEEGGLPPSSGTTTPTLQVAEAALSDNGDASQASYQVRLLNEPASNVIIVANADADQPGQVRLSTDGVNYASTVELTFTPGNWQEAQTVYVKAVDDIVDEGNEENPHPLVTIEHTYAFGSDSSFDTFPSSVVVTVIDNDGAGVVVAPLEVQAVEGGIDGMYGIRLRSQPSGGVYILADITADGDGVGQIEVSSDGRTFGNTALLYFNDQPSGTAGSWADEQTVYVRALVDDLKEGPQSYTVQHTFGPGSDPDFKAQTPANEPEPVTVTVLEEDSSILLLVSPTEGLVTSEDGGADHFTVRMTRRPTDTVVIGLRSSDPGEGTVEPEFLMFNTVNWNETRTVTVTGVDDTEADGDIPYTIQTISDTTTTDPTFFGFDPQDVAVVNQDDETTTSEVDLGIDGEVGTGDGPYAPGSVIRYTLSYTNSGVQDAAGVQITVRVPSSTMFQAETSTKGWNCADQSPSGTDCVLTIGDVAAGSGDSVTFAVVVSSAVEAGAETADLLAEVSDDGADRNKDNDQVQVSAAIDASPDLTVDLVGDGVAAPAGGTKVLTLNYRNTGNQHATGVVLTATFSPTITASVNGWTCEGSTCTYQVGRLEVGQQATDSVTITVPTLTDGSSLLMTVTIQDDGASGAEPSLANNEDTETILISTSPSSPSQLFLPLIWTGVGR
ncbi:MAG: DUF11 domain-containing protein [Chloroflexaceae bacterium]|nr:DUF11 domain-containing protein [Chloroflexaceae bacterium]